MCSLENRNLCQGEKSFLRPGNMLIHPNSITHEDTFMPKKIRKIFRKSPRPSGGVRAMIILITQGVGGSYGSILLILGKLR